MLHDRDRLLTILRWVERFSWLFAGGAVLLLLSFIFAFITTLINLAPGWQVELKPIFWLGAQQIIALLQLGVGFIVLQGLARMIRYLLTLQRETTNRRLPGSRTP